MKDGWHLFNKVHYHMEIKEGNISTLLYLTVLTQCFCRGFSAGLEFYKKFHAVSTFLDTVMDM